MQSGTTEEVFKVDEGVVVLQYPEPLTQASIDELEGHFKIMIGRWKRSANAEKSVSAQAMIDKRHADRPEDNDDLDENDHHE